VHVLGVVYVAQRVAVPRPRHHVATDGVERILTRDQYAAIVNTLYHYHSGATRRLTHAAQLATEPDLKRFLGEMIEEEHDHEALALSDLSALGRAASEQLPKAVADYERNWCSLDATQQLAYAGMLYALESVPAKIVQSAIATIARLDLTPQQTRFLAVHLEADLVHTQMAKVVCEAHAQDAGALMLREAQWCLDNWLAMILSALRVPLRAGGLHA
jgi:hypothetical protein